MSSPSISALTAGNLLQRDDAGLDEERHEAEPHAVLLLEAVAVALAQRHHRAHVHLVEGGEHGGGVLRLLEALGDALAQPRHAHALLARAGGARRGAAASAAARRGAGAGAAARQHVAPWSGGRPCRWARAASTSTPVSATSLRTAGPERASTSAASPAPAAARRGLRCGAGAAARRLAARRAALAAPSPMRPKSAADRDVGALGRGDLGERAGGRRRQLERHLVGLELDQRIVERDGCRRPS